MRANGLATFATTPMALKNGISFRGGLLTNIMSRPRCDAAADLAPRSHIVFS